MGKYLDLFICIPKSLYFNFKYLSISDAIKLPFFVRRTILKQMRGNIIIEGKIIMGMVRMGFGEVAIFDRNRSRGVWQVSGKVVFKGITRLDHGTSISVGENGILTFGKNFNATANSSIICKSSITFGNNCLISWDTLIMDTDFHKIRNFKNEVTNPDKAIKIGNSVWIGCRSTILKGSIIADNIIVAAGSVVTRTFNEPNQIIGGNPSNTIRTGFHWDY